MRIFRLVLLAAATALAMINFWAIDYSDYWSNKSLWAYVRIGAAIVLVVLLVNMIRKEKPRKKSRTLSK